MMIIQRVMLNDFFDPNDENSIQLAMEHVMIEEIFKNKLSKCFLQMFLFTFEVLISLKFDEIYNDPVNTLLTV
jgi:hypothetical protein